MNNITQKQTRWGELRYQSLNYYLKSTYGEKMYKLSLNGNMTCPNRDGTLGTGGCAFCSEGGSGDFAATLSSTVTEQIEQAKLQVANKATCKHYIAYFQAFTNTYAPISYLREIFTEAIMHKDISILSIATRSDCISDETIELLKELNQIKPVWIELGFQTMHTSTHEAMQTHFSLEKFNEVVTKLSEAGIKIIAHVILGLPGETHDMMLQSISYLAKMPIWGVKLQLLHVLKNTALANLYETEPFHILSMEEYTSLVVECIALLPPNIVIHRITGDGPKDLLIAPLWSSNKKMVLNTITKKLKDTDTYQGKGATYG